MASILSGDIDYGNRAIGALLQVFLIYCNNCPQVDRGQLIEDKANVCVHRDFKSLVDERFKD